ncbi:MULTISPECIES: TRAP transporter small permease [Halomonas]|jgi:TRAP-type C4-dicarboxylate transport system permease small subunit|uniref:TRAP transporter small permease protein n=1 Tax=Halomonas mongoliensis TaxID=321265 RepID=A0ABU1GS08_9GAMM|nr:MULTISPECIES: TRAP transporter small permease subunit [Halomonas]MDR5894297.1 TRAP transporter small permease subunit [Halomonas mongoliensis]
MQALSFVSRQLARLCLLVAGLALLAMMGVTIADVLLRLTFRLSGGALNWSVVGSVELVRYLLMFSLLAAMAASVERSQVVVEAFSHGLSPVLKERLGGLFLLGFVVLGAVMAVGLWQEAGVAAMRGQVTQDLRLPMAPIYQFGALLCALLALRSLLHALLGTFFATDGGGVHHE